MMLDMLQATKEKQILELAKNYLSNWTKSLPDELADRLTKCAEGLISQEISFEKASEECQSIIGTAEPIEHIRNMVKTLVSNENSFVPNDIRSGVTRHKSQRWTEAEDQRLTQAIKQFGVNNWGAVTEAVGGGRTRSQCSQRWNRVLDPKISKTNWTKAEEHKLIQAVRRYGTKAWTRVANEVGNRSDVQCRFKYLFIVKQKKNSGDTSDLLGLDQE